MNRYIIFSDKSDLYRVTYSDVISMENVRYLDDLLDVESGFLKALYRIHINPRINDIIHLPLRNIWNRFQYNEKPIEGDTYYFIFFTSKILFLNYDYFDYIKTKYNGKIICVFQDLIGQRRIDVSLLKKKCDLLISFDYSDVEKYGFVYYPLTYSHIKKSEKIEVLYDVYFVGKAKNRLQDILDTYTALNDNGLKCDFYIIGVPQEDRKFEESIHYIDFMPYQENVSKIQRANCILEIMQKGGTGYTLRTCEAIMLNKKLLTNNTEIEKEAYYNPRYIQVIRNARDIDYSFFDRKDASYSQSIQDSMSPVNLLKFITERCEYVEN